MPILHRRIDMKTYPWELFPLALVYFTGPANFNRTMRFCAEQKCVQLEPTCLLRERCDPLFLEQGLLLE